MAVLHHSARSRDSLPENAGWLRDNLLVCISGDFIVCYLVQVLKLGIHPVQF